MITTDISRRFFISGSASLSLAHMIPSPSLSKTYQKKKNLIIIMLRGGMDGITAVPPKLSILDRLRPDIVTSDNISLTSDFSLHPALETFHKLWQQRQAAVVHATSIPYVERSHFDGQNVMQSGVMKPYIEKSGWLGRAIELANKIHQHQDSLAISLAMPLLIRGQRQADNYFPTRMRLPSKELLQHIATSYADHDPLNHVMQRILNRSEDMLQKHYGKRSPSILAGTAAQFLKQDDGPNVAVFDMNGFDSHTAQGGEGGGEHGAVLSQLDITIRQLKDNLGDAFDNTLIMTLTEFGRTVTQNGGYGTDHGYGTAILLAGGLLKKAQIFNDFPGLEKKNLYQGRDLLPTIDARSIYASAISLCFDIDIEQISRDVFFGEKMNNYRDDLFIA